MTRFYAFGPIKPFLYYCQSEYYVSGEAKDVVITSNRAAEILQEGFYLPEGIYTYINNNTFFKTSMKTSQASKAPPFSQVVDVQTFPTIFPEEISPDSTVRTKTLTLQVTPSQRTTLISSIGINAGHLDPHQLLELATAIAGTFAVQKNAELICSFGLAEEIQIIFGDNFKVHNNVSVLGKTQPFCEFATSHPDLMVYHTTKYIAKDTLYGAALVDDEPMSPLSTDSEATEDALEPPQSPYMTIGLGGEDKLRGKAGEPQVVAAMIINLTQLAKNAVNVGKFFSKSVMFGYVRTIEDSNSVIPYRLTMDFNTRVCIIYRGLKHMELGTFLITVRHYLANPDKLRYS